MYPCFWHVMSLLFLTGVCQLGEFTLGGSFQLIAVSPLRIFKLYGYSNELLFEQVIPLDIDGGSLYKCVGIYKKNFYCFQR